MKIINLVTLTIIFISLIGCTPNNMIVKDCHDLTTINAEPGKATVIIARYGQEGMAVDVNYYVDGQFIGATAGYGYLMTSITPGNHYVTTKLNKYTTDVINFKPDTVYFFENKFVLSNRLSDVRAKIMPINKADFIKALSNSCNYYELDNNSKNMDLSPDEFKDIVSHYDKWNNDKIDNLYENLKVKSLNIKNNTETFKYEKTVTRENIYTDNRLSSKYNTIVIKNFTKPKINLTEKSNNHETIVSDNFKYYNRALKYSLIDYIKRKGMFVKVEPNINELKGTLVVDGDFVKFNSGNNLTKFMFGFALGDSQHYVTVNVRLLDAETGEILASFTDREAGMIGARSYSGSDDPIFEYQSFSLGENIGAFIEKIY